jgi:hypothetical protein
MGGHQPQHVATGGGTSSGGFPAAPSGQGPNRNLWIAMGVIVAAAAVIIGIIVTQSGGDEQAGDDPTTTTTTTEGSDTTTTTYSDTTGTTSAEQLPGYGPNVEEEFVNACASQSGETVCQCIYDRISRQIEFDRFIELSQQINTDGTNVPTELVPIISECALGSSGTGT